MFWDSRERKRRARRGWMRSVAGPLELLEERSLMAGPSYPMPPTAPPTTTPVITPPPISIPARPPTATPPVNRPVTPPITTPAPTPVSSASTPPPARPPVRVRETNRSGHNRASGVVTKAPHFYEAYTGPKLAELNAVRASAELSRKGSFVFTGTVQGRIKQAPAVFVWGIDRNGNLGPGPFTNRPNIQFDAVVIVSLDSPHHLSAQVVDLASGATTALPARDAKIRGKMVSVSVTSSLLPSTGLNPSHYRFNFWPEDGGPPVSSSVASFAPEFNTAQVGISR